MFVKIRFFHTPNCCLDKLLSLRGGFSAFLEAVKAVYDPNVLPQIVFPPEFDEDEGELGLD